MATATGHVPPPRWRCRLCRYPRMARQPTRPPSSASTAAARGSGRPREACHGTTRRVSSRLRRVPADSLAAQLLIVDMQLLRVMKPARLRYVPGDLTTVLAAGSCGAFVLAAEPVTIPLLQRAAAIDVPSLRSSHSVPTPRGGGAPIALGLVLAALLIHSATAMTFAAAVAFLLIARTGLPPAAKAAAAVVVAVWVIGFVNAFNFMDGVNGISAAHALIGGAAYACLGAWRQDTFLVAVGAAVAVGALAFLPWNAVRARVFLGDVGSYGLGAALAVLAA